MKFLLLFLFGSLGFAQDTNDIIKYKGFNIFLVPKSYIIYEQEKKLKSPFEEKKPLSIKKVEEITKEEKKKEEIFDDETILFNSGVELYNTKNYQAAESSFIQLLQKYPDTRYKDKATLYLGEIMLSQNRTQEALMYFNKINQEMSESPVFPLSMYKSATVYYKNNNYDEAIKLLITVEKKFPSHNITPMALILLGDIYRKKKDFNNSIKVYQNVIKKYKNSDRVDDALFKIGDLYENEPDIRNLEIAKSYYERIVKNHPTSEYYSIALDRIEFIKKNFLEYK